MKTFFLSFMAALGLLFTPPAVSAAQEQAVPDFSLPSIDGKTVSLRDFAGKTVVLNFWASWCDSCQEEMPLLLKLKEQYGNQGVVFVGINAGDSERAARRFVDKMGYSYQILLDGDKSVSKKFQVLGLPQTLVISSDGRIIYRESRPPVKIEVSQAPGGA